MLRRLALTAALASVCGQADAAAARFPVTLYQATPGDRPDPATVLSADRRARREIKHVATTWGGDLFDYLGVGRDCQATNATVTVARAPQHGELIVTQVAVPTSRTLEAALPRRYRPSACANLPVQRGFYRPDYGYVGRDRMAVSFREGDAAFTDSIDVDVRAAEHPNPLRPHH